MCSSVGEHVLSICRALGSILNAKSKKYVCRSGVPSGQSWSTSIHFATSTSKNWPSVLVRMWQLTCFLNTSQFPTSESVLLWTTPASYKLDCVAFSKCQVCAHLCEFVQGSSAAGISVCFTNQLEAHSLDGPYPPSVLNTACPSQLSLL